LWGNSGKILRKVRNPVSLAEALADGPVRYPAIRDTAAGLPRDGTWLRKPLNSGGGRQIVPWDAACQAAPDVAGWHFQQKVQGTSCSATYVAAGGRAALLGATEQLVGADWTAARGFHYSGSLGPLSLTESQHVAFVDLGHRLAGTFGLVGLFGVDLAISSSAMWLIEVNPRFPASLEVLERAYDFSAVAFHVAACREGSLPDGRSWTAKAARSCGKAILFARRKTVITPAMAAQLAAASVAGDWPAVADIPAAGTILRAHWPIVTLRAESDEVSLLLPSLQQAARHWQGLLNV
jgi:predicted ATP-grasp superfamily ATP-dependent carboligase